MSLAIWVMQAPSAVRGLRRAGIGEDVAPLAAQALAALEHPQLGCDARGVVAVGADAPAAALLLVFEQREQPVAERCLGERTEARDRSAAGEPALLRRVEMGRVHERPLRVDRRPLEQPRDRTRTEARLDLPDFALRFRDMDMNARPVGPPAAAVRDLGELPRRDRAQAVQPDAEPDRAARADPAAECVDELEVLRGIGVGEPPLRAADVAADAAVQVEGRQQRHRDAARRRRGQQALGHLGGIGVARASGRMVQVVELADRREAALQELHVGKLRDRLVLLRRERID